MARTCAIFFFMPLPPSYFCNCTTATCATFFSSCHWRGSARVVSFVFFFFSRNTKLYKTGHCFAGIRRFARLKKYENTKKRVSSCFVKQKKRNSHVFLQLCTLSSSLLLFFEFRTFYSSFVPFFDLFTFFEFHTFSKVAVSRDFWELISWIEPTWALDK